MPDRAGTQPRAALVARLRAAGCVFAEDEAQLLLAAAHDPRELAALVDRRVAGEPLEHVLGWVDFCGLRLVVAPAVFVPRRRTELLARETVALTRAAVRDGAGGHGPCVVDLCCGSGAVAAVLAAALDDVEVHAVDLGPAAVRCARRNLQDSGARVYEGDLFQPLPAELRERVDVLVANVPYVPTAAIELMPPEARLHEPRLALDGGEDGLDVMRRVSAQAAGWLAPGGHLLVEASRRQAPRAVEIMGRDGLIARVVSSDELGATVVIGQRPRGQGR